MSINLKDLKKFPGNKNLGGEFMLLPVDTRKYNVKDIPKLPTNRVQVRAIIPQSVGRPLRPFLCLVSDLPDKDQTERLITLRKEKRLELVSKDDGKTIIVKPGERTVAQLINQYVDTVLPSLKNSERYEKDLREIWEPEIGHLTLNEITADDIEDVKDKLINKELAASSINNRVQCLKSAFRFGAGKNKKFRLRPAWVNNDVSKDVEAMDLDNERNRYLSPDELKRLREQIKLSTSDDLEDVCDFLLAAGCRWSEMQGLTWDCFDKDQNVILFNKVLSRSVCSGKEIVRGKTKLIHEKNQLRKGLKNGSKGRVLDIENLPKLRTMLLERKLESASNLIFPKNPRTAFRTAVKRATEIAKAEGSVSFSESFHWHDFRHTCLSYLAQNGVDEWTMKAHGGHESLQSLERYSHLSPKQTRKSSAVLNEVLYGNG
jgi:integrase